VFTIKIIGILAGYSTHKHSSIGYVLFSGVQSPLPRSPSPAADAYSSQPSILVEHGSLVNFKVIVSSIFKLIY